MLVNQLQAKLAAPYLSLTAFRLQLLALSLVALTQADPKEPQSLLLDRSTSCALATRLAQLSGMLPVRLFLPSERARSTVPLPPQSGLSVPAQGNQDTHILIITHFITAKASLQMHAKGNLVTESKALTAHPKS